MMFSTLARIAELKRILISDEKCLPSNTTKGKHSRQIVDSMAVHSEVFTLGSIRPSPVELSGKILESKFCLHFYI